MTFITNFKLQRARSIASLAGHAGFERRASARAFAQAHHELKPAALTALNAQLLDLAQASAWMPLWHGLRV
jgi:hypothetical protein